MTVRRAVRAVLITQDAKVREIVGEYARNGGSFAVSLDLDVSLAAFTGPQFKVVEQSAPALVLMDFDGAPELGVSLARDLSRANQLLIPVGIGSALSSEQLLQAMRAGLTEYLVKPVTAEAISDAVERLRPRLFPDGDEPQTMARTLGFFSAKGGSGSSTVVTNLAIELRRLTTKRTLVMDLDAELGEVSLLFGIQPQFNLVDLIQNFHRIDSELLGSYIEAHDSGVHVLSAPYHPERAAVIGAQEIRQVLSYLRGQYDTVLLDTPKSFSPESLAAFEQCDEIYIVATVDLPSLRNIQRALPLLRRIMPRGLDQVNLIVNRYDPEDEISLKDVERSLNMKVFATIANDYDVVIRSINSGKPATVSAPKSAYVRDIQALATKLASAGRQPPRETPTGILARLFRAPGKGGPSNEEVKRG
jgi:pilus assembly protein CpaE